MTTGDDRQVRLTLLESTIDSLMALLKALAELCEPGHEVLTADVRSYVSQALDNAADLDLLFGVLGDALLQARVEGDQR